jgi:hypothetical protein
MPPLLPRPPSLLAEAASLLLRSTLYDHSTTVSRFPAIGRILSSPTALGHSDGEQARRQAAFLRMVSITEAYTDALSEQVLRRSVPTGSRSAELLLEEYLLKSAQTWSARKTAFVVHHQKPLTTFPEWQYLSSSIDLRNSIAHGLGGLSNRQKQSALSTIRSIRKIGVEYVGGRFEIWSHHVYEIERRSRAYVLWLDAQF